jgi:hypothetical protein
MVDVLWWCAGEKVFRSDLLEGKRIGADILGYCSLIIETQIQYSTDYYNYEKVFIILGYGVCLARGAAASIKFTSAIILLPVLRNFLSWYGNEE